METCETCGQEQTTYGYCVTDEAGHRRYKESETSALYDVVTEAEAGNQPAGGVFPPITLWGLYHELKALGKDSSRREP